MSFVLRHYQEKAVSSVYEHLRTRDDNPCVVMPTASGKSLALAQICKDSVIEWGGRVLIVTHVKELLEQNHAELKKLCPEIDAGIYSAGLKRRDTDNSVIFAGIQSVHRNIYDLGRFDLIIVDEVHLVPDSGEGMYRTFFQKSLTVNPDLRVIGFTATPYRLKGGLICKPENILNHVCYEYSIKEAISEGFLCKPISRGGITKIDLSGLHIRAGEFIASDIEDAMNRDNITRSACLEISEVAKTRKKILIFASSVEHCGCIAEELRRLTGEAVGIITGDTPTGERAETIARFKGEVVMADMFNEMPPMRFLVNVNVLTTGFNATAVDCVVLLRPTASVAVYVQTVGRGMRLHPGKDDCLILDYGGNVVRHGPIDNVVVKEPGKGGGGEAPAKECEKCNSIVFAGCRVCPMCGEPFPEPESKSALTRRAAKEALLSGEITEEVVEIARVQYFVHEKRNDPDAPKTMRIEYQFGYAMSISEWVCPDHTGWARSRFEKWWKERSASDAPMTTALAVEVAQGGALAKTSALKVRYNSSEKFPTILEYDIGEKPQRFDYSNIPF